MIKINKYSFISLSLLLPLSLVSCSNIKWDGLIALPTIVLNINEQEKILNGIKDKYLNDDTLSYNKLTIPKSVEKVTNFINNNDEQSTLTKIKKIDYELNCLCQNFLSPTFASLINLEEIIFPPKITNLEQQCITNCNNLKLLDISNLIECQCLVSTNWISNVSLIGTIICDSSQKKYVDQLIENNQKVFQNWTITIK